MACLEFNDDTKVYLSDETTNRLREELCKPVEEQLVMDKFRAMKDGSDFVRIAIMPYECNAISEWDGEFDGNAEATHLLYFHEVREVANGLLKMIGD